MLDEYERKDTDVGTARDFGNSDEVAFHNMYDEEE